MQLSRISEIVYPDGKSVKYTYDVLDNLKTVVDRDGNTTTYEYDAKNRIIKVTRPNGSYTTISYNELDGVSKLENNTAEGMVSSFEYKYNDKGQIVKETATNKDVKSVKEFAYDAKGELESFVENRNGLMIYTTYSYDNVGNRISKEVKKTDQNVRTNYTYNELNQLTTESEEGKSDINYSYDANGNLVEKNDGETTLTYSYTVEDRLQAVKEGNKILMAAIYDGNGDRVFTLRPSKNPPAETLIRMNNPKTGDDIIVYIAIFVASIVVIIMFNYKNEKVKKAGIGLLTVLVVAGSITIISINSNKETESYTPNVPSNKESRQINEDMIFIPFGVNENDQNRYELTQYINDVTTQNTQVLMEYSNESGITAYTYGNERISYETNGVNYKYNYDGRGSVTNLLDSTNTSVVEYNYQPFGETEIIGTKAQELENTYQFNAESTDALTGLQYLRARYYDSKTGRFTSQDSYRGEITDPLSRNLYLYTKNDPVKYVDPSGHLFESIMKVVQTVQGMVQTAAQKAIETIESSPILRAVKNVAKGAITAGINKIVSSNAANRSQPQQTNNVQQTYGASINPKAEKTKELESQLRDLRNLGTMEASLMAEVLEQEMKKACESDLEKLEIIIKNEYTNQLFKEAHKGDWFKDFAYSTGATVDGFVLSVVNNTTGSSLRMPRFFEDYEQNYYGGAIAGDITSSIIGAIETIAGITTIGMGFVSLGGGMVATATGVGAAPGAVMSTAGVGEMAIGGTVTEIGTQTIARSGNSLRDDIQNFKESGSSSNTTKNISEENKEHIFRNAEGHFKEDTPRNRKLIEDVANNKQNYMGKDKYGNEWYAKTQDDGTQIWASVRDNEIRNGGVNIQPRTYNPETGLSSPNKP